MQAKLIRLLVLVFTVGYMPVTKKCVQSFMPGEKGAFFYDPDIEMASASHVGVVAASVVILALVFFYVPLRIRRLTRSLRARNLLREPHTRNAFGSLYDAFKPARRDSAEHLSTFHRFGVQMGAKETCTDP